MVFKCLTIDIKMNVMLIFLLSCLTYDVIAKTCNVTVLQGDLAGQEVELVTGEGTYCSFKGIPYAKPPTGDLRFKAPQPADSWEGVRNATEHGSVCPQVNILQNEYIPGNEDCLFVNVYSRNLTASYPVLVFIHGGSFRFGSGDVDLYGPDFFLRDNFDMVVVTMNYRLDVLGFLNLGTEEVPGNAGLKDQVLALKWVQNNIEYFGGDPNKVTIMGQSAGAVSVGMHMVSPMSTGLFQNAIPMSGSPFDDFPISYHSIDRAIILAKQLGCNTTDSVAVLSCFQNATSEQLVNYTFPYLLAGEEIIVTLTKQYPFTPVVEEFNGSDNFLSVDLLKGNFATINSANLLFGHTNEEGLTFLPYILSTYLARYEEYLENFPPKKFCQKAIPDKILAMGKAIRQKYFGNKTVDVNTMKEFIDLVNDVHFIYDIVKYYMELPNNGTKYMYKFSSNSSRNLYGSLGVPYGIYGAAHTDDLSNCFDPKARNLTLDMNSNDFEIIERWTTVIKNFVHTGNPNCNSTFDVNLSEFDSNTMEYLNIGTYNVTVGSVLDESYYSFLSDLFESFDFIY